MRVISHAEFLSMPRGTVYCEGEPWVFGEWKIKLDNCNDNDWFYDSIDYTSFSWDSGYEIAERLESALKSGEDIPMDFSETCSRDGCYDAKRIFIVLSSRDVTRLIQKLQ